MENKRSVFETLAAINVNSKKEKKDGSTYLSWVWAWGEVKKMYPSATYKVLRDPVTHKPYFQDINLGYMVMTEVTIEGETLEMWLPVMNGANKAMKDDSYTYEVANYKWENGKKARDGSVEKTVEQASMFDINKTLMRCLTKNLAMFGLGYYIYAGEDLPTVELEYTEEEWKTALDACKNKTEIQNTVNKFAKYPDAVAYARELFKKIKTEL